MNLKVEHPPPYERILWDCSRVENVLMNGGNNAINWEELLANKTIKLHVSELNDLFLIIYANFFPKNYILCNGKDSPCVTIEIRTAIEMENNPYKEHIRSGMKHDY